MPSYLTLTKIQFLPSWFASAPAGTHGWASKIPYPGSYSQVDPGCFSPRSLLPCRRVMHSGQLKRLWSAWFDWLMEMGRPTPQPPPIWLALAHNDSRSTSRWGGILFSLLRFVCGNGDCSSGKHHSRLEKKGLAVRGTSNSLSEEAISSLWLQHSPDEGRRQNIKWPLLLRVGPWFSNPLSLSLT